MATQAQRLAKLEEDLAILTWLHAELSYALRMAMAQQMLQQLLQQSQPDSAMHGQLQQALQKLNDQRPAFVSS